MLSQTVIGAVVLLSIFNGLLSASIDTSEDDRVIGGKDVPIDRFPHQVSLQYNKQHYCGGSIYNNRIIITAAHCLNFTKSDLPFFSVLLGTSKIKSGGTRIPVESFAKHQLYNPQTINYDVGLIKLKTPITFGETMKPITLAQRTPENGTDAVVTGWGVTKNSNTASSETLKGAQLEYISRAACTQAPNTYEKELVTPTMICAGSAGKGSCRGDSGGPLVNLLTHQLLGLVSWGRNICAAPGSPGVFVSVPALRPWIESSATQMLKK